MLVRWSTVEVNDTGRIGHLPSGSRSDVQLRSGSRALAEHPAVRSPNGPASILAGMNLLLRVAVNAAALAAAAWLLDGIQLTDREDRVLTLLAVAVVFGLVNALVAPVVKLLSLPFIILTLGLLLWVINAAMLLLTSRVADGLGLGFEVDGFGTALLGALVISVVGAILGSLVDDD